jgi:hypothetical protein
MMMRRGRENEGRLSTGVSPHAPFWRAGFPRN